MLKNSDVLLEVQNLTKYFPIKQTILEMLFRTPKKVVRAVDGVDLIVRKGENLGLVGESGCGKSTLARTIIRLCDPDSGTIHFEGKDITAMTHKELRTSYRDFQMIFQDPYSSLNPRMTVRETIEEALYCHNICPKEERRAYCNNLLEQVGLSADQAERFPGEFSGGQRQRIGIARALALSPKLVIADEPVSALDVSIQAQVINLLFELQEKFSLTLLFISHDLRVVRHITKRTAVMYLGKIVEIGSTEALFAAPKHPYTRILLRANPNLDPRVREKKILIEGELSTPIDVPAGCRFHPRCPYARSICSQKEPLLREIDDRRSVACHLYGDA